MGEDAHASGVQVREPQREGLLRVRHVVHGVGVVTSHRDPFELLGAPRRFDLDLFSLEKTHRELSRALHPDKFAQASASERRAALEKAASVNEAWRTLRDPIRRAEALFTLAGIPVGEDREPKSSPMFLMDVMEQREELAEARAKKDLPRVRKIGEAMKAKAAATEAKLAGGFATGAERDALERMLPLLGELRFFRRFLDEISAIEEENEDLP
ncbi:MAG: Fe-S protein assembly co-chaperone HscB [Deltaproteobacteria bacterium]|nr:Fe-S protein assembly co-chaperone HscB [Deltaproteobacteria bacterium]